MSHSCARRAILVLFAALLLVSACSDEDSGEGNPLAPSTPNNPPASGVVLTTGTWTGTSAYQQNGIFFTSNLTAVITQRDRQVEGNVTFTSPGYTGWTATFTGQLSGAAPSSQFFGNVTIVATAVSGSGTCTATAAFSGETRGNSLRWEAPTMRFAPTGSSGGTGCQGDVFTIAWILSR
jgi:hypothetical protein